MRCSYGEVYCTCSGGCVLCDAQGMRPIDRLDVVRLRRTALNRGFKSIVLMAERAIADDDDAVAWYACAEALR